MGRDCFDVSRTGVDKSLIYQMVMARLKACVLVVCLLFALIDDQVRIMIEAPSFRLNNATHNPGVTVPETWESVLLHFRNLRWLQTAP
jgi:hypothetical protein